jgi:uncharacterized protein (DUF1810 family)
VNNDPYDLRRFLEAQAGVYGQVLAELAAGMKRSHWMWFIFPQIKGLGASAMAHRHASHTDSLYHAALKRWCNGVEDPRTVSALNRYARILGRP